MRCWCDEEWVSVHLEHFFSGYATAYAMLTRLICFIHICQLCYVNLTGYITFMVQVPFVEFRFLECHFLECHFLEYHFLKFPFPNRNHNPDPNHHHNSNPNPNHKTIIVFLWMKFNMRFRNKFVFPFAITTSILWIWNIWNLRSVIGGKCCLRNWFLQYRWLPHTYNSHIRQLILCKPDRLHYITLDIPAMQIRQRYFKYVQRVMCKNSWMKTTSKTVPHWYAAD